MQKIMNNPLLTLFLMLSILLAPLYIVAHTSAAVDIEKYTRCGSNVAEDCDKKESVDVSGGKKTINDTIANIINIFSWIVGTVAVIMIIYGGFRYVTAGGDSGNISSAKNTILYAIVGLVIVAISQAIVWFVLDTVPPATDAAAAIKQITITNS
jgi:uncharacterized membrane protein